MGRNIKPTEMPITRATSNKIIGTSKASTTEDVEALQDLPFTAKIYIVITVSTKSTDIGASHRYTFSEYLNCELATQKSYTNNTAQGRY
jgi:hypothetical protein